MADGAMNRTPCFLCGKQINYAFTVAYPQHRLAGTAHHIHGLAQGGDPLDPGNLVPAHRGCNTRESNRIRWMSQALTARPVQRTSRRW